MCDLIGRSAAILVAFEGEAHAPSRPLSRIIKPSLYINIQRSNDNKPFLDDYGAEFQRVTLAGCGSLAAVASVSVSELITLHLERVMCSCN